MKKLLITCSFLFIINLIMAQTGSVGIGTTSPDPTAALDVSSADKGILIPRVETTAVDAATGGNSIPNGLLVFQPSDNKFYFYNTDHWEIVGAQSELMDIDGDTKVQVEGAPDDDIIRFEIQGTEYVKMQEGPNGSFYIDMGGPENANNLAIGTNSLMNNIDGDENTAIGSEAMSNNEDGYLNTAVGRLALHYNLTGSFNTAIGANALESNTSGIENVAVGSHSLLKNTNGKRNVAIGDSTLIENTLGDWNVAVGDNALENNIDGKDNVAVGTEALHDNVSGQRNIAMGTKAMEKNNSGYDNVAIGHQSLNTNFEGYRNVAVGYQTLDSNLIGNENIAIGTEALKSNDSGDFNVAVGTDALYSNTEGNNNVAIGKSAGYHETGDNKLYIENTQADSSAALIYGEFDNDKLRLNAEVNMRDGWSDADGDTKIELDKFPGNDEVRFQIDTTEYLVLHENPEGTFIMQMPNNNGNIAMGNATMNDNTSGNANIAIGENVLADNTSGSLNVAIGANALFTNETGGGNVAVGYRSLESSINGSNVAVGSASGASTEGFSNTYVGNQAGEFNDGGNNVLLGSNSGQNLIGDRNVALGNEAGMSAGGDNNVFLGNEAGKYSPTGNRLYIENSDADSTQALIYGEFDNDKLRLNAEVNINDNYILPTTGGTAGQVMKINSDGTTAWQEMTDGWAFNFVGGMLELVNFSSGAGLVVDISELTVNAQLDNINLDPVTYQLNITDNSGMTQSVDLSPLAGGSGTFETIGGVVRNTGDHATEDFVFGSDELPQNGVMTSDTLFFFDKDKGAFRAGRLSNSTDWSPDSIGIGSFASGYNTKAIGKHSTAMGSSKEASGFASTAMGNNTEAIGKHSTAMGNNTEASSDNSTAMGNNTEASGFASTAMGNSTIASENTSTAMGSLTKALGPYSTAMGNGTEASGSNSIAMGSSTLASGIKSTAMGDQTTASGTVSTAMGDETTASAPFSTAMGRLSKALGNSSTAMGLITEASGSNSTAMGHGTIAKAYGETAIGTYNTEDTNVNASSWDASDRLFTIGNGTNIGNRSDAMIVYKNGNTEINGEVQLRDGWVDADGDTGIKLSEGSKDSIIFSLDNQQKLQLVYGALNTSRLEMPNNNNNIAIGQNTLEFTGSGIKNVAIGSNALNGNDASMNIAIGDSSSYNNFHGYQNTSVGASALHSNMDGVGNVALGNQAGYFETGSNKLYIENTNAESSEALIYGEFDNDKLRLNAEVNINGDYTLPTDTASANQFMIMGADGKLKWHSEQVGYGAVTADWGSITTIKEIYDGLDTTVFTSEYDIQTPMILDQDGDTKIEVQSLAGLDDDKVRFDIDGTEKLVLGNNADGDLMMEILDNSSNIFIGEDAGENTLSSFNVFIGNDSGKDNIGGMKNTFIGNGSGRLNTSGRWNTFIGVDAGFVNTSGNQNTYVGEVSGRDAQGDRNSYFGIGSGRNINGDRNVAVGNDAGNSASGSMNVFLGNKAGYNSGGDNKLYIENSNADSTGALIYGEFDNDMLRINGYLGIGTNAAYPVHISDNFPFIKLANQSNQGTLSYVANNFWELRLSNEFNMSTLGVDMTSKTFEPYTTDTLTLGTASYKWKEVYALNATINTSDIRFKKNINNLEYGLETVMQMRPVSYQWKKEANGRTINGFIAQEMEEIVPEVVEISEVTPNPNKPGTESEYSELYGMRYTELIPVLTKAIQDQQAIIEDQKAAIDDQKTIVETLLKRVEALENDKD